MSFAEMTLAQVSQNRPPQQAECRVAGDKAENHADATGSTHAQNHRGVRRQFVRSLRILRDCRQVTPTSS